MRKRDLKTACMAIAASLMITACGEKSTKLSGAGATFPLPFYNLAFQSFKAATGTSVSYGGVGSGSGIRSLKDQVVDFAGSDAYLSDAEMVGIPSAIHIPTCIGAVVLSYNLPGITELCLSSPLVAAIYKGEITRWNDDRIREENPGIGLPDMKIVPVFRSDGSGTTYVFTDYLCKVSPEWQKGPGRGKAVDFPTGLAAKGNPGVAGTVKQTIGSIGYVGSEYAFSLELPYASMKNASGHVIRPGIASITAAATGDIPDDTRCSITNATAPDAYPISCLTWIIVYREQKYEGRPLEKAKATYDLMQYLLHEAQADAEKVNYAPLPESIKEKAQQALHTMVYDGSPLYRL